MTDCIPYRNFKRTTCHTNYIKTRYVVERFFAWFKNGFHRARIRYEMIADNYLGFIHIASFLMYFRILGWLNI